MIAPVERYPDLDFARCIPLDCLLPDRAERSTAAACVEDDQTDPTVDELLRHAVAGRILNPAWVTRDAEMARLAQRRDYLAKQIKRAPADQRAAWDARMETVRAAIAQLKAHPVEQWVPRKAVAR